MLKDTHENLVRMLLIIVLNRATCRNGKELRSTLSDSNFRHWVNRSFSSPAPFSVKAKTLERFQLPDAIWVETGTNVGLMAEFLSKISTKVITIEPFVPLFEYCQRKFKGNAKVILLCGTSEDLFEQICSGINQPVCFWLDGHFSGDGTFSGEVDSPINFELEVISKHAPQFDSFAVFIDDFRLFPTKSAEISSYPDRSSLVDWANRNNLHWTIENDIFIAATKLNS